MTIATEQLSKLPKAGQQAFSALAAHDAMSESAIRDIILAGELSGQWNKLLGFAPLYFALKESGVHVHDALSMAKDQGRAVNLSWSRKRWRDVHNQWSRAAALEMLSEKNVTYDLGDYEDHLPETFPGYIIKTSRRLGMEGLRQRHCIASYHPRIEAGHCAVVVVFVNRTRWTVELRKNASDDRPLRISAAKSVYNKDARGEVMERIRRLLDIDESVEASISESNHLKDLRALLPKLRERNVENIYVRFAGYGDSGSIDEICFSPETDASEQVRAEFSSVALVDDVWKVVTEERDVSLEDAIESVVDKYLEYTNVNWYDNEGGFGECEIDVVRGRIELNVNVNHTESTNEWWSHIDIQTGADVE